MQYRAGAGRGSSVAELLHSAGQALGGGDARLDAELLLCAVLGRERSFLFAHPEFRPGPVKTAQFNAWVDARAAGRPVAYLTGRREFWSLDLRVSPATLIPRPETETLVERCLERVPPQAAWSLLDLGTGSGAIALALAAERPRCSVTGCDRVAAAVTLARDNARRLGLGRVDFVISDWFSAFSDRRFHLIAANPPYIAAADPHLGRGDVAHEPRSALVAGQDGLTDLRHIVERAKQHLLPGGWLLLEHGYDQRDKLLDLLRAKGYDDSEDFADLAGHPRVAAARLPA